MPLPTGLQQIRLTREEFEELVRPYLAETVALLQRCVEEAGFDESSLAGISLVGGSSRSPIVEEMVKQAFPNVPVIRRGDPKTAVASGAARAVRSSVGAPPSTGQATQEAAPGTAPEAVRLAAPVSNPPPAPGSNPPVAASFEPTGRAGFEPTGRAGTATSGIDPSRCARGIASFSAARTSGCRHGGGRAEPAPDIV